MLPVPSAFSSPPMRCVNPGVPGTAHGRASVSGSRAYGRNVPAGPFGSVAKSTRRSGNESTDGTRHGSDPFAIAPSESSSTGVRYVTAIRAASSATSKASAGDRGATTGTGDSPLRPYSACSRSACSVFVGRPVDGPPRCTSTITSGSSVITASPIVSDLSASPGPDVVVTPSAPPYDAPSAAPTPAISSSAWIVVTPNRLSFASSCRTSDAGVIGYDPSTSGRPERCDAATRP